LIPINKAAANPRVSDNGSRGSAALPLEVSCAFHSPGRLPTPAPTAPPSLARHRCSYCTAPPSSVGGDLTFRVMAKTSITSSEVAAMYSLVASHMAPDALCSTRPMGLPTLSPAVPSSSMGSQHLRPPHIHLRHWQAVASPHEGVGSGRLRVVQYNT
jgi:hypothetical protein